METILNIIREELVNNVDEKTRANSTALFKEKIKYHGVKVAFVTKLSKELFKLIGSRTKSEIFDICDKLWQTGYIEESFIACNWTYYIHKKYEPEDFKIFERWVHDYVSNWASCDTLCNHSIGEFIEMYPAYLKNLKGFAKSGNR